MKNKFLLLVLSVLFSSFKSQSVIIDIGDSELGKPGGYYSKDINNILDQFEGTYVYTNGTTSFKIVLVKKIKQYNSSYYEDLIIGEYQYIINGVEQMNTLSNLNIIYNNQFAKHAIAGNSPLKNNNITWKCPQCNLNERRLRATIMDRFTNRSGEFYMRKTIVNAQEVLQVKISNILPSYESANPPDFSLPRGEFTMIKQ